MYYSFRKIVSILGYKIRKTFEKITRIFSYLPVLWRDEDWDWFYIIILLQFKLARTKKCILKANRVEGTKKITIEIQEVIDLLEHVKNARDENMRKLDEVFGVAESSFKDAEDHPGMLEWIMTRPRGTKEEHQRAEWKAIYLDQNQERLDINRAFGMLAKNLKNWWD